MNSLENEEREQLRNRIHPIVYNPRPGDGKVLVLVPTTYLHAYLCGELEGGPGGSGTGLVP